MSSLSAYQKGLFATLSIVYMLPFIQSVGIGVVSSDLMNTLDIGPEQMGMLGSAYLYAYAGVQLFSGLIAARLGPKKTLATLFITTATGCVVFAGAESLVTAALGRALCGMGMAATMTSALTVFGRWYPASIYASLTASLFSIGGMGAFIATAPLSFLNQEIGWRGAYYGIGGLTALGALAVLLVVKNWPAGPLEGAPGAAQTAKPRLTLGMIADGLKKAVKLRDFWKLCCWYACVTGIFYAFHGLWGGPYLREVYGLSSAQVGGVLSMGAVGFVVGNPLVTWFCERHLKSYRLGLGWACVAGLVPVGLLLLANDKMNLPLLYLLALLLGMAANAPNAIGYAAARTLFGARLVGTVGGILGFSSFIGGACLQVGCGLLLSLGQAWGYSPSASYVLAFAPFLPCLLLAGWATFSLTESYGRPDFE